MPRMTYKGEGYHNATDEEVEALKKEGWTVITDKEFAEVLAEKRKAQEPVSAPTPVAKPVAPVAKAQVKHGDRPNAN